MDAKERLANREAMNILWDKICGLKMQIGICKREIKRTPESAKLKEQLKWMERKLDKVESAYEYTCRQEQAVLDAQHEEAVRWADDRMALQRAVYAFIAAENAADRTQD